MRCKYLILSTQAKGLQTSSLPNEITVPHWRSEVLQYINPLSAWWPHFLWCANPKVSFLKVFKHLLHECITSWDNLSCLHCVFHRLVGSQWQGGFITDFIMSLCLHTIGFMPCWWPRELAAPCLHRQVPMGFITLVGVMSRDLHPPVWLGFARSSLVSVHQDILARGAIAQTGEWDLWLLKRCSDTPSVHSHRHPRRRRWVVFIDVFVPF